jgi:DNA-binding SARP family transcriptional activator
VLALLLLHANEVVPAEKLIDDLWGDAPPETAANTLQGYVSRLRKTLEPDVRRGEHELLVSGPRGYALQIRPEQLDADRFVAMTNDARRLLDNGHARDAVTRLDAALGLWRGPAFGDLAHESFARAEVERLEELRLSAVEDRIEARLALGTDGATNAELHELVARHPFRERLRGELMLALYRSGRQADALAVYRDGRRLLRDAMGIEPGPALRDLERAILRQDPELGPAKGAPRPIAPMARRRAPLLAAALVVSAIGAFLAAWTRDNGHQGPVVVRPHSVAVIDPASNRLVGDVAVGAYPGPIAADDEQIYVGNIGDATVSTIAPRSRSVSGTSGLSRAIDLVAADGHLWAANGGVSGHTPTPPGTVVDLDLPTAAMRTVRVGPSVEGDEEQTTIAADSAGEQIWVGNKDSATVTQVEPPTLAAVRGIAPGGIAVVGDENGNLAVWASDPSRNAVVRIDAAAARITDRITVPGEPTRIAADAAAVWVIARDRNGSAGWRPTRGTHPAIWRIDPETRQTVAKIPLPLTPLRIAMGVGSVWVTAQRVLESGGKSTDATVFRIDPATNRVVARIRLRTRAVDGIVVSHGFVWVAVPASQ